MFVDADEFRLDTLDTSYGYARNTGRNRKSKHRVEDAIHDKIVETVTSEANTDMNSGSPSLSTFLRADLNPCSTANFLEETAIRAGCSGDALGIARCVEDGPSGLEDLVSKTTTGDAALLAAQLDLERRTEWKPSSLFSRLGVDESGLYGVMSIFAIKLPVHKDYDSRICAKN
ncbi:hypothetical protein Aduo_005067 [Ancylostoma duodenale]